jgi:hypothetical protein
MESERSKSHIGSMTARDKFPAELRCPKCGREGVAQLSEEDGWAYMKGNRSTSVDHLPDGFKVVKKLSYYGDVDIFCATDDVSALKKQR